MLNYMSIQALEACQPHDMFFVCFFDRKGHHILHECFCSKTVGQDLSLNEQYLAQFESKKAELWLGGHNEKVPGSNLSGGPSVWSFHVLPVLEWSKDTHVSVTGGSKLPVEVITSVYGCSSTWRSVQGVPLPLTQRELD